MNLRRWQSRWPLLRAWLGKGGLALTAGIERLFVLLAPKNTTDDAWIRDQLADLAKAGRLPEPKYFRAEKRRLTEIREGSRAVNVVRPQDAAHIYLEAHRAPTLVIAVPSIWILLDPRRDPATLRTTCRPDAALRHKGLTWTVLDSKELSAHVASLSSPHPCDDIDGPGDPRVLPLHLFRGPDVDGLLGTAKGRDQFKAAHRKRRSWVGPKGCWQDPAPGAMHGNDRDSGGTFVSGWRVPEGHHWDVQPSNKNTELVGFGEVWRVERGGHVNVFPNGKLLGNHRARRTWPRG